MINPIDLQTYTVVRRLLAEHGYPPSVRDVAVALGLTTTPTHRRLLRLREMGLIKWKPNMARSIQLVRKGKGQEHDGH